MAAGSACGAAAEAGGRTSRFVEACHVVASRPARNRRSGRVEGRPRRRRRRRRPGPGRRGRSRGRARPPQHAAPEKASDVAHHGCGFGIVMVPDRPLPLSPVRPGGGRPKRRLPLPAARPPPTTPSASSRNLPRSATAGRRRTGSRAFSTVLTTRPLTAPAGRSETRGVNDLNWDFKELERAALRVGSRTTKRDRAYAQRRTGAFLHANFRACGRATSRRSTSRRWSRTGSPAGSPWAPWPT